MNDDRARLAELFLRLTDIVDELRLKCPWDRVQTRESIRHLTIEETYELVEAIEQNNAREIKVELGDLFLHLVFYASLARDAGEFTLSEVIQGQVDKLIRRHPHIYGDLDAKDANAVQANWEQIKAQEKADKGIRQASVLDGVPQALPSLIKAQRMQEKAASQGFDWSNKELVWDKIREELQEFEEARTTEEQRDEMGDLLFTLVNYCRFIGINADDALAATNQKFMQRFQHVEQGAFATGRRVRDLTLEEMEGFWQEAKLQKK